MTSDGDVARAHASSGRDRTTDLVLLDSSDGERRRARPRPSSSRPARPRPGDAVWVVGAPTPGAKSPWMSSGMVASTDALVASDRGPTTSGLLETDAASERGFVGRRAGRRRRATSPASCSRRSTASATTYAVPIDDRGRRSPNDLREQGYTTHGALGIDGIDSPNGPMVTSMDTDGPAADAGVRVGDLVESVDDHVVYTMSDVMALVRHDRPASVGSASTWHGKLTMRRPRAVP